MVPTPSASAELTRAAPETRTAQTWPRLNQPEEIAALVARFRAALPAEMAGRSDTFDVRDGLTSEYARVLLEAIKPG